MSRPRLRSGRSKNFDLPRQVRMNAMHQYNALEGRGAPEACPYLT